MENIASELVEFEQQCIVDEAKVFYFKDRVFRAVYNKEQAELYTRIFTEMDFKSVFEQGLIKTTIATDIKLPNSELILEHEKIDFFLDPCEMTDTMFWDAAISFIRINRTLIQSHLILKDAHPWNMTFHKGKPLFFDFGSIESSKDFFQGWLDEFYTYFAVPIYLASTKWPYLAIDYRRQHHIGFGLKISELTIVKKYLFKNFFKLAKDLKSPELFLEKLEQWVLKLHPKTQTGSWDGYEQDHDTDYSNPVTVKQKFVYNILAQNKPKKVTDLATNKGYYSFMAESLGATVIGFDYEAFSVNTARKLIKNQNITFCQMNFLVPTSAHGWGLIIPDAFTRFYSDVAMALGLIHHVCLIQRFPVKLFCDSCAKYASNGVILEFIYPEDIHVMKWAIIIPDDYNKQSIQNYFSKHYTLFQESDMVTTEGIRRQFFFFYNRQNIV